MSKFLQDDNNVDAKATAIPLNFSEKYRVGNFENVLKPLLEKQKMIIPSVFFFSKKCFKDL